MSLYPAMWSLHFESPVALIFTPVDMYMYACIVGELCQILASSPVSSKPYQSYMSVTGVLGLWPLIGTMSWSSKEHQSEFVVIGV